MHRRDLLVQITFILFLLLISACSTQTAPDTALLSTRTLAPIQPTETSTLTPIPEPTSTPTITPTPIGGKSGLLMYESECPQHSDCVYTTFLYNLNSHELTPFVEGYFPLDVSPDGRNILLKSTRKIGDLYILDLTRPDQKTLLHENVDVAVWLGDSEWIGLISTVDDKEQVFIIHPDGSDLAQVTHSPIGAVTLEPAFNDGIFWGEGIIDSKGVRNISASKWTKLDGTEKTFINFDKVAPSGKYVITLGMNPNFDCFRCNFDSINLVTDEITEIILSKPDPNVDFNFPRLQPLTDEKWLIRQPATSTTDRLFYIYSSDGSVLTELLPGYEVVAASDPPHSYDLLSPDGSWIMVYHSEKGSDEQSKTTYYLMNIQTLETQELPNLTTDAKFAGRRDYFWVEIP